ncbi:hypothetical protein [Blastopirellula marina]|uniref:Uncharacterized protein n=1 Tax=Blastopirellula marina TaxID=124 RepID=A0A2S8GR98_9BACT|nr:hypothetical protein [Blastopirellula marina]PQO46950.1 hypothetical protein C5Y93_07310 [Blastopirellula marina]
MIQQRQEEPTVVESITEVSAPRWRFSITRLIIATAVAPLPLLLVCPGNASHAWCFAVSGLTLFGLLLTVQADDLPRLNVILFAVMAPAILVGAFWFESLRAIPLLAIVFALPAIAIARAYYPLQPRRAQYLPTTGQTLASAFFPYVLLNGFSLLLIGLFSVPGTANELAGRIAGTFLGGLLLLNLYWLATNRNATLTQRPELGFRYETTMILLPAAISLFCLRTYLELKFSEGTYLW